MHWQRLPVLRLQNEQLTPVSRVHVNRRTVLCYLHREDVKENRNYSLNVDLKPKDVEKYFDIRYVNNINKGKATIILTAKDKNDKGYVGAIIGTFTIKAHELQ